MAGVEVAEVVGGGGGGDAGEDARGGLDQGDVEPLLAEDGGGLEADVAAADDERAGAAGEGGGEGVGVGEAAHQQDAVEVAADLGGEAAGGAAGGQREEVVGQPRPSARVRVRAAGSMAVAGVPVRSAIPSASKKLGGR